jgi:hypothetical protein
MKRPPSQPPPLPVPRHGSLLQRLQQTPKPANQAQSYLDQLMIFLDNPPPGTRDRWKRGAKMCTPWGIPCTGASVWRLYRSYALEWRLRLAHETDSTVTGSPESLEQKAAQMVALRTYEVLAHPHLPHSSLVSLARIEFRKKALEFAREKFEDARQKKIDTALELLADEIQHNPLARASFAALRAILQPAEALDAPLQP